MSGTGITIVQEVLIPYEHVRRVNPSHKLQNLWAAYWGTQFATSEFWFSYAQYCMKLEELGRQLNVYAKDERSRELFLGALERLKAHFNVSYLAHNASNIAGLDETFNIIYLSSAILPPSRNKPVEPATAEAIAIQIDEMVEQLSESDIPDDVQAFLKSQFVILKWAACNYQSIGIDGLSKAYGMVASEFMRVWGGEQSEKANKDPWWKGARDKMKLIGEGVIWSEKLASGAEKLIGHADDVAGLFT